MELIKKIYRKSIIALIPLAILSAFIEWKKLPISIIIGGLLGLANIKGLAWGVEGFFGQNKAGGPMVLFSMIRLTLLIIIIAILLYLKLVNIIGVLIGLTVIFTVLMIEGVKYARNLPDK